MKQNFKEKGQVDAHKNCKEEAGAISAMRENACQYAKTFTQGKMKVTVFYPEKTGTKEEEIVEEVKSMVQSIIMQQIRESEGEVKYD